MALLAGDTACTTGLSKRIYDVWTTDAAAGFGTPPLSDAAKGAIRALCHAVAVAVVAEVQANAQVSGSANLSTGAVSGSVT